MSEEWRSKEINACVRTYLWMLRAEDLNFKSRKKRVRDALIGGPLAERTHGSVEYRFQNISSVRDERNESWIEGYKPKANVGPQSALKIERAIEAYERAKHGRRIHWLINALPTEVIVEAVTELAGGRSFDYPDSTNYDLVFEGVAIPPKKAIGYAGLLYYGAPLFSENFSGGEGTPCFRRLIEAGFSIAEKGMPELADAESQAFRGEVRGHGKQGFKKPPHGNSNPKKRSQTSICYERDPQVVAFVEGRADGRCELCGSEAPFKRSDGTPFLEVHHIVPLAKDGSDQPRNAAALCPNCHRACHHGADTEQLQAVLLERVGRLGGE